MLLFTIPICCVVVNVARDADDDSELHDSSGNPFGHIIDFENNMILFISVSYAKVDQNLTPMTSKLWKRNALLTVIYI